MTDLYYHSELVYAAASTMHDAYERLQVLITRCSPAGDALLFGPRTPGLEAAALLDEKTGDAINFVALMVGHTEGFARDLLIAAEALRSIEEN